MTTQLPVLDISVPDQKVSDHLVQTISKYGFVYIKNHGLDLDPAEIDNMFSIAKQFFYSPLPEKAKYSVNSKESGKNSGWFGMNVERLDPDKQRTGDFKEAFNMNEFLNGKAQQPMPPILKENEHKLNHFIVQSHAICLKLLELLAVGLGIEEASGGSKWFLPQHDSQRGPSGSVLRLLYYPKLPLDTTAESSEARCGAHSDYGTLTLLFQREGQPGLEILTDSTSDTWSPVPVNPTQETNIPILVNVGDLLSYWTNGALKSAVHRVTLPDPAVGEERFSIAYFCHPMDSARLEPVPSKMVQEYGAERVVNTQAGDKGRVLTAKQHLESRLSATLS